MNHANKAKNKTTFLIEPKLWSRWDNIRAETEGWYIFVTARNTAEYQLCKRRGTHGQWYDCPFNSLLDVGAHISKRADQGSKFHERAIQALVVAQMRGYVDEPIDPSGVSGSLSGRVVGQSSQSILGRRVPHRLGRSGRVILSDV